jgi:hypothetical protein
MGAMPEASQQHFAHYKSGDESFRSALTLARQPPAGKAEI